MSTPNYLSQIRAKIREIEEKSADGDYIYRGEPECHQEHPHCGKVSSSLWREYGIEKDDFYIEIIQKEMLNDAKKHTGHLPQNFRSDFATFLNLAEKDTEEIINFEILTEIQHYGGKTNLIDFTTDSFIALFFACDGYHNKDGRVILQKTEDVKNMINHPRNPRHRVIAQKSVFIRPPKGFIKPREDELVIIPANLKQLLLQHLRKYHGTSTENIYNDLYGFIRNQGVHGGAYTQFYRGFACQDKGDKAITFEVKQKEYGKSIEHYTKAIELKPDFLEAYNNRGNAHCEMDEPNLAIEDFNKAIALKSDDAEAYNNRGTAYKNKGNYDRAIMDYNMAIQLKPNLAQAYDNRGNAYINKGNYDRAITDFNTAIEMNPSAAGTYNNRGMAYSDKGLIDRAIEDYNTAIEFNPDMVEAYSNRGVAYQKKGLVNRAIEDYTAAIGQKRDYAMAYNNRGVAYRYKGNFDHAMVDLNKAIQLNPNYATAYNNRGVVWLLLKEWESAKSDLTTAKNMGVNIMAEFCSMYGSVANFERIIGTQLPADLAEMLTPRMRK